MPRFFDDYSNTYLTHDSAAGRKQQRRGWKFRENFKLHYEKKLDDWRAGPMGLAAAQQAFLRNRGSHAAGPLPPGWTEEIDKATGISFYTEEKTQRRTWVRPGFRPPPAGPMGGMMSHPMGMGGPPPPHHHNHHHHRAPPPQHHGGFRQPPGPPQHGNFPPPPPGAGGLGGVGAPPPLPWGANAPPPPFSGPPPPFPGGPPPPGSRPPTGPPP